MPHSLRARLSGLRYKGIITDKDYQRLCKALDTEKAIEDIKAKIQGYQRAYKDKEWDFYNAGKISGFNDVLAIIETITEAEWKESEPLDDVVELMEGASE